nr:FeoB-associated Cys-rich membrane protein [uncultured Cellulosilyticum sp.]
MADFIVLIVLAVVVFFALRHVIKNKKVGGCGCGCSGCSQKSSCTTPQNHKRNKI